MRDSALPGAHQYDNKIPQANDVVYSVSAAHAAVPDLGGKWVAIGHSQGGSAVWGVAELRLRLTIRVTPARYRSPVT